MQRTINNIINIKQSIANASLCAHQSVNHVQLIAVSKNKSAEQIKIALHAGINDFGESYVQEALLKQQKLQNELITWHFIGPIQSNKAKKIAENFTWVHSIDRVNIAEKLNQYRPEEQMPLQVCIQINIDDESSKSGIHVSEINDLVKSIDNLPKLKLRGLMCIPKPSTDPFVQEKTFKKIAECLNELNQNRQQQLDTLSMGMSNDYLAAIRAGSTLVRIGTLIWN